MAIKILLDTNICIYLMNGGYTTLEKKIRRYSPAEIAISSLTLAELEFGIANSARAPTNALLLNQFIASLAVLPFGSEAAWHYGQIRIVLERTGKRRGLMDMLIAAHARSIGATLVTNDKAFKGIPRLRAAFWA